MFLDRVTIFVAGGNGGDGCLSFRREKYVPRGGPDGGDGGNGGSVIVRAEVQADSLAPLAHKKHWKAKNGRPGSGSNRHGKSAGDLEIAVPPGTVIRDAERDFTLKDLTRPGEQVVVARGGRGGRGNAHFKSATNQAPREFTPGQEGERRQITLELKLIADVGLIGKPNAGKSTLLARVSRARPEIADYPFTTKFPHLGQVIVDRDRSFVMADIPGLIEGAHEGTGLGLEFLRHIERTKVLVHLVEPQPMDESDPVKNYDVIRQEIAAYDISLADRPEIVVVSKCELPNSEEVRNRLIERLERPVLLLSAATGEGIEMLLQQVSQELWSAKEGESH